MKYKMSAEWEQHKGTWLAWPHNLTHWPGKFEPIPNVYLQIIKALAYSERVFICVNDEKMKAQAEQLLDKAGITDNIEFFIIPTNASWSRDHGPIFVRDEQNQQVILDWGYNANGNKWGPCDLDDQVPEKIAAILKMKCVKPGIILEGGSIDVNGQGSLLTTKSCLLNKNRNPKLSKKQIEKYLANFLGAKNIIWLEDGILGDDTDGHIDDIARFVNAETIVYALEENIKDENYKVLQKNLKILKKAKSENGRPFKLISLPMPKPLFYENQRLPASYCNFYISNKTVIVPIFHCPQDQTALKILSKLFSTRKVIGIDCVDLVWGLGTLHCSTQQQPI